MRYQRVLNGVDILKFVHQQMMEHPLGAHICPQRVQQQVIQVAQVKHGKALGIGLGKPGQAARR